MPLTLTSCKIWGKLLRLSFVIWKNGDNYTYLTKVWGRLKEEMDVNHLPVQMPTNWWLHFALRKLCISSLSRSHCPVPLTLPCPHPLDTVPTKTPFLSWIFTPSLLCPHPLSSTLQVSSSFPPLLLEANFLKEESQPNTASTSSPPTSSKIPVTWGPAPASS